VIQKLVGIGKGASYAAGHMQSPPSPSKTSILEITSGGIVGIGVVRGGEVTGVGYGGVEGNKNLPSPHTSRNISCRSLRRLPPQL